ncbi:thermonuclease family protein [Frigoribacterium sp. PvP032]|uniref:thermonuclease family protein n=1 Tax=Frigoribacterium sp. PvP032 TaxID=2806589 RepID=UPI001AE92780|nr:thermonuclease family protein [Frigoribacterium sp. PvP032]MBP1190022.1 micrococcal nuclease [Frigoribacterium sp. PvP032]
MSRSTAASRRRTRDRSRSRAGGRRALLGLAVVAVGAVVVIAFPQLLDGGSPDGSSGSAGTSASTGATASVPSSVPPAAVAATVERVVDGDTVIVVTAADGARERLRLIGVDTPETVKPDAPVDCFGPEASAFTTDALPVGSTVWLEDDASQGDADRYDRLLRYVWTEGGSLLNQQLVAAGLGTEDTYDQPYRYRDAFVAAEAAARDSAAGLWGACR